MAGKTKNEAIFIIPAPARKAGGGDGILQNGSSITDFDNGGARRFSPRRILGWGALLCALLLILLPRFEFISRLAPHGLESAWGLEGHVAIIEITDLVVLPAAAVLVGLARFLLRSWPRAFLQFAGGVLLVAFVQYVSAYLSIGVLRNCPTDSCTGPIWPYLLN